jgi:aminopeptidase-like protein
MPAHVVLELVYNEMARRLMMKQTPTDIALAMGLKVASVERTLRHPNFKAALEKLQATIYAPTDKQLADGQRNIREEILTASYRSFDRLKQLLENAVKEETIMHVAQDMLDRAGFTKKIQSTEEHIIKINPLDADILAAALDRERKGQALAASKEENGSLVHPIKPDDSK